MPSTRQRTTSRKRNIRNGALLAVSEVVKLANIPLAQDVSRHLKQVAVALKPSVLQAPNTNDSNAKGLAKHVEGLLDVLNKAIQHLDGLGLSDDSVDTVAELVQVQTQLSSTYIELQDVQNTPYTTKFASQTEIRDRILQLKEELTCAVVELTLRLLMIAMASSAQSQMVMARHLASTTREHKALARGHKTLTHGHKALARDHAALMRGHAAIVRKHGALVRAQQRSQQRTQRRQRISDKRVRSLTHEVNANLRTKTGCWIRENGAWSSSPLLFNRPNVVKATYEPR